MIIDMHAHLDESLLAPEAIVSKMEEVGIDKVVMIPRMNEPIPHTPTFLLTILRKLSASRFYPLAQKLNERFYTEKGDLKLSGKVIKIFSEPDNETVRDLMQAYPDKFLGWIFLNPHNGDPVEELERWRNREGYVGVKLHPHWHRYAISELIPLGRRCEALGLPCLIHLGFGASGEWRVLCDACPKLKLILAHAGFPSYGREWRAMRRYPNIWVDVSSPYINAEVVRDAVLALGPHRVLYGSDAPYGFHEDDGSYDYREVQSWVESLHGKIRGDGRELLLGAREIDRILGGNVVELLDDHRAR